MIGIAVAEVKQQLDIGRNMIGKLAEGRAERVEHFALVPAVGVGLVPLQPCEHGGSGT